jgi:hypothetical protein
MKTNLRKLQLLGEILPLERFYVITVYPTDIKLQGYYKRDLVLHFQKMKFSSCINEAGMVVLKRSNIEVTLTD